MPSTFDGFDFFLEQVDHRLRPATRFAFEQWLAAYRQIMQQMQPHLTQAARHHESEQEKARFIAAIEQLQRLQPHLLNAFALHLLEALKVMTGQPQDPAATRLILDSFEALAAHAREDEVYLKNLTDKSLRTYNDWNRALTRALQGVLGKQVINEQNDPFGPIILCNALYASLKISNMHSSVRKAMFELFEQQLFHQLTPFYRQLAEQLIAAGIAVQLPGEQGADDGLDIPLLSPQELSLDTIDSDFNQLLENSVIPPDYHATGYQPMAQWPAQPDRKRHELAAKEIDQLLAGMQKGYDPHTDGELLPYLQQQLQMEQGPQQQWLLSRHDENIINLLGLAFRQLAETQPESIAELFGRLKVPYTRLVLGDELFFHDRQHPARRLLDKLTALTFSSHDEQLLFKQVQHCVTRIGLRYKGENALFRELLELVDQYLADNEQPFNDSREQMARQFEAAENRRMASEQAGKAVAAETARLPRRLRFHLLAEKLWQAILAETRLTHGADSVAWRHDLQLLGQLVDMTDNSRVASFKAANRNLATTIREFRQLLESHNTPAEWQKTFFDQLQEIQILLMRGRPLADIDDDELGHTFAVDMIIDDYESEMVADIDTATIGHEHQRLGSETLVTENSRPGPDMAAALVKRIAPGQWINILHDGRRTPCYLSYYSSYRHSYIFCDRYNNKLFERSADDLLKDFTSGYASVLDKTTHFEACLASVLARLKAAGHS